MAGGPRSIVTRRTDRALSRHLIVVDRYDARVLRGLKNSGDAPGTDVLLLGLSPEWFAQRDDGRRQPDRGVRFVDCTPLAADAHRDVAAFVVDLVATLPHLPLEGSALDNLLRDRDDNLWWMLEISERSPFRGQLIRRLYELALLRLVATAQPYAKITCEITDTWLAAAIQTAAGLPNVTVTISAGPSVPRTWRDHFVASLCIHACSQVVSALAIRAIAFIARWPNPASVSGEDASFSLFPRWWERPFESETQDRFLPETKAAGPYHYVVWMHGVRALWRHRNRVRAVVAEHRFVVLQRFIGLAGAASAISPGRLWRLWRAHQRARALRVAFRGFEVGRLVAHDLAHSLSGGEVLQDLLLRRAVAAYVGESRPRSVLYRAEFQPAEHALVAGLRGRALSIGFIHHPFGEYYLAMRFADGEITRSLRGDVAAQPLPDAFVCNGAAEADHVTRDGYPRGRVALCGPQRLGRLLARPVESAGRAALRRQLAVASMPTFFVALAIVEADTEALFGALTEAARTLPPFQLLVRTHPNRPEGDPALLTMAESMGDRLRLLPSGAGVDVYDYIAASDAMICIGSTIAFEAMVLGTMPIVFENPATFNVTSLVEFDAALFVARNTDELRLAIDAVQRDLPAAQVRRGHWPQTIERVLGDLRSPLAAQLRTARECALSGAHGLPA
jgi:hypothetical protein